MKTSIVLFPLAFLLVFPAYSQAPKPESKVAAKTKTDLCATEVQTAGKQAYADGFSEGAKLAGDLAAHTYETVIGDNDKPLKIKLIVEEIEGEDAYRYAAAEVIRTQFAGKLVVAPEANLNLWIQGSEPLTGGLNAVMISAAVTATVSQRLTAGKESRTIFGRFTLSDHGNLLTGYSQEQRTQVLRELAYKVLSDFLDQWEKASKS